MYPAQHAAASPMATKAEGRFVPGEGTRCVVRRAGAATTGVGRAELKGDAREQDDAGSGQRDAGAFPPTPTGDRTDRHRPDELDRHGRAQRQVVDRRVEGDVHRREHRAEGGQDEQVATRPGLLPGPAPQQQDDGGDHDPEPRHGRRRHHREEPDRERRTEVLGESGCEEQGGCGEAVDGVHGSAREAFGAAHHRHSLEPGACGPVRR